MVRSVGLFANNLTNTPYKYTLQNLLQSKNRVEM
nr:MAG TPA: hypothetical protein [Caudoviricetes sp.]